MKKELLLPKVNVILLSFVGGVAGSFAVANHSYIHFVTVLLCLAIAAFNQFVILK